MHKRALVVGMILVLVLLALGSPGWAAPPLQARSVITYPTDGMTVSGVVQVTGIATHPNMNFYQLRYAPGSEATGGSQWVDFAIVEGAQVENNVLGAWDTTVLPDGQYTLAMAVWGNNDASSPYVTFVARLTVNNAQPVPSPTPETEQPTPEPMPTAADGATPTPISIEQPATPTPRPSPMPAVGEEEQVGTPAASEDEQDQPALPFDTEGLRSAFCSGGLITVMLFLLWGLYLLAKASLRWYLRSGKGLPWQ